MCATWLPGGGLLSVKGTRFVDSSKEATQVKEPAEAMQLSKGAVNPAAMPALEHVTDCTAAAGA